MTKKRAIIGVVITAVLSLFVYRSYVSLTAKDEVTEEPKPVVSLLDVNMYKEARGYVEGTGQVEAFDQIALRSELNSKVKKVYVEIGDIVKKGELLVELDHGALDAQLEQASAAVARMQGTLDKQYAIIFGLAFSSVLTLLVIPILYQRFAEETLSA
ncbi:MAG: biotin/lipoyl-binding protein [Patescibacteria group bacterium]|nr:biotin/lipoyl-binding protein [Patescibacteria group bacterium]